MHVTQLKDGPRRYVQFEDSKLDDALSSDSSEDVGEETRRKQASDGHQSSSTGTFAYPGTKLSLVPGGQRNDVGHLNVVK